MSDLKKDVKYVKGVGPNRAVLLNSLGIFTLGDLITYFPRGYEDRTKPKLITELANNEEALIEAKVLSHLSEIKTGRNLTLYKLMVEDESGVCQITWYNQSYLKGRFKVGQIYKFYGKVSYKFGKIDMHSPVFEEKERNVHTGKIVPIYPSTYNLTQNIFCKIMEQGLVDAKNSIIETLPDYLIKEYQLLDEKTAIEQIHFPTNFENFQKARKRLAFEELLFMQLALLNLKNEYTKEEGICFNQDVKMSDVIHELPFKLTSAQLRVLEEIDRDMESSKTMNRLVQGDVGSGKTVVSMIAAYKAVKSRISSCYYGANCYFSNTAFSKF